MSVRLTCCVSVCLCLCSPLRAETLRSYFSQYGEVVDCVIMKDKTTNQSRGFGFVKFKDPNCVGTVLASRPHTLDGRNVSASPALASLKHKFVAERGCQLGDPFRGGLAGRVRWTLGPGGGTKRSGEQLAVLSRRLLLGMHVLEKTAGIYPG